jgi:hypothetical protein
MVGGADQIYVFGGETSSRQLELMGGYYRCCVHCVDSQHDFILIMPTATLIKRDGSSALSLQSSLVVELIASSSGGGSHSRVVDNCNGTKDASISVASSQSKYKIQKEKMVAKKSQPGVKKRIRKNKQCNSMGCTNFSVKGGVCITHGAKHKRCRFEGCTNQVQKGGVCTTHGAKKKRCSFDGCPNQVQKGGVCATHGAKKLRCSHEGCTNGAVKGGVCVTHGAKRKQCSFEECAN